MSQSPDLPVLLRLSGGVDGPAAEAWTGLHLLAVEQALESLHSSEGGLSSSEAARRLREFGLNRVERPANVPPVLRLLAEFVQFFSVILWIAAALAFVAEWTAPGQGMARIGWALIAVIVISGVFSFW